MMPEFFFIGAGCSVPYGFSTGRDLMQSLKRFNYGRKFYSDPSRVQNGSYVKIGRFGDGADLQYQDTIEDSLIKIV